MSAPPPHPAARPGWRDRLAPAAMALLIPAVLAPLVWRVVQPDAAATPMAPVAETSAAPSATDADDRPRSMPVRATVWPTGIRPVPRAGPVTVQSAEGDLRAVRFTTPLAPDALFARVRADARALGLVEDGAVVDPAMAILSLSAPTAPPAGRLAAVQLLAVPGRAGTEVTLSWTLAPGMGRAGDAEPGSDGPLVAPPPAG